MTDHASTNVERLFDLFVGLRGQEPRLFFAPGRINVIGEHTDYAGGLAMPAAIDKRCLIAAAPNADRVLRIRALDLNEEATVDLDRLVPQKSWTDYVAGVAFVLAEAGVPIQGADLLITSNVPIGAGVSSSAALEVAATRALLALAGVDADGLQVASWAQAAENRFVGVPCGIMDQFASANGVAGSALVLDCARITSTPIPMPKDARFLLVHSMVRHRLADGAYAERRADCAEAAQRLGLIHLADLEPSLLASSLANLPERAARRCRHVVSETARVRSAIDTLAAGDLETLGDLLNQSHASLRDDMEVSLPELDYLAQTARGTPGVLGARMMGGGFGGCVLMLVRSEAADAALAAVTEIYGRHIGERPIALACSASAGAGEIRL